LRLDHRGRSPARQAGRRPGCRAGHPLEVLAPVDRHACSPTSTWPSPPPRTACTTPGPEPGRADPPHRPGTAAAPARHRHSVIPPPRRDRAHRLHWSYWRRRHQHRARQAHQRWNAYAETAA
jgi:hypothetical protein